jgi:hypothetical protein
MNVSADDVMACVFPGAHCYHRRFFIEARPAPCARALSFSGRHHRPRPAPLSSDTSHSAPPHARELRSGRPGPTTTSSYARSPDRGPFSYPPVR